MQSSKTSADRLCFSASFDFIYHNSSPAPKMVVRIGSISLQGRFITITSVAAITMNTTTRDVDSEWLPFGNFLSK
jgi:hypothetical protein